MRPVQYVMRAAQPSEIQPTFHLVQAAQNFYEGRTNANLALFCDIFSDLLPDSRGLLPKTNEWLYIGREAAGEDIFY